MMADLAVRRSDVRDTHAAPALSPAGTPASGTGTPPRGAVSRDGGRGEGEVRDTGTGFLLRLCLDLQIDALLLALAEAARETVARGAAPATRALPEAQPLEAQAPGSAGATPWRAWLEEDVEHARTLAADVVERGGTLPAVLGSLPPRRGSRPALDALSAHYDVIQALLGRVHRDVTSHRFDGGTGEPWADRVLEHYRRRLDALRNWGLATARVVPSGHPREFVPGEFLG